MKRKRLQILLVISICLIAILFQAKFHKPPIEFQSRIYRLIIEYSFFILIGISIVSGFILIKYKLAKALYSIFGLILIIMVFLGLLFTWINNGETYKDIKYYKTSSCKKLVIKQYYGHGAFGSSERLIIANPINSKIRWIRYLRKSEKVGNFVEVDKNGNVITDKN